MGSTGRRYTQTALVLCSLLGVPAPAQALELSTGVSAGGFLAGTVPHIAVSPHVRLSLRKDSGLMFAAQGMLSVLLPNNGDGVGVYGQTTAVVGYAAETRDFSVGPSLSIYTMPACGAKLCGRVVGVAPGGHAQVNAYLFGPLGVSVNADVDWLGGKSLVLAGGVATMVVVGPVLRWATRE